MILSFPLSRRNTFDTLELTSKKKKKKIRSNTGNRGTKNGPAAQPSRGVEHDHDHAADPYSDRDSDEMGAGDAVSFRQEHQHLPRLGTAVGKCRFST